jgi:aminopeptidase N
VKRGQLTPVEQTTLLEDVWTLVYRGEESIGEFLSLSHQLVDGELSPAISTALSRMNYISERLVDEPLRPAFERWVRGTVRPLMDRLGWTPKPGEGDGIQSLRSSVIFTMGSAGRDAAVLREAQRLARLHVTGVTRLDASIAETALQLAAIDGNAALYDLYLARMVDAATSPAEQRHYLGALSFFSDAELQNRTLAYTISSNIRTQDAPTLIRRMMQRPSASATTWQHVKNNWDSIERSFGIFQGLPTVVGSIQHLCDVDAKNDVNRFFGEHRVAGTERALQQSLESIERCAATKSAQAPNLAAFLAANSP